MKEKKEEREAYRAKGRAVKVVDARRQRDGGAGSRVTVVAVGDVVHVVGHCGWRRFV